MSTLAEIQAATATLPREQQEELYRSLAARLQTAPDGRPRARLVREGDDLVLEAPSGAPPMTPESVKRILEDWP